MMMIDGAHPLRQSIYLLKRTIGGADDANQSESGSRECRAPQSACAFRKRIVDPSRFIISRHRIDKSVKRPFRPIRPVGFTVIIM